MSEIDQLRRALIATRANLAVVELLCLALAAAHDDQPKLLKFFQAGAQGVDARADSEEWRAAFDRSYSRAVKVLQGTRKRRPRSP